VNERCLQWVLVVKQKANCQGIDSVLFIVLDYVLGELRTGSTLTSVPKITTSSGGRGGSHGGLGVSPRVKLGQLQLPSVEIVFEEF
jgi:hypothetical protein